MSYLLMFIVTCFSFVTAQTYCAGDQISISHQNATHPVGAAFYDYQIGDDFKLADWNGELNGGDYSLIFIDMSASW